MSNKYPDSYVLSSSQDVAVVRRALIHYQESLRSDLKSFVNSDCFPFVDSDCFQQAFEDLNAMVIVRNLLLKMDSCIQFDDSDYDDLNSFEACADTEVLQ